MNNLSPDLTDRLLRGGVTLTAARLLTRGFDLARMLTIARWLGPDEMGVYAVATLALTAFDQLSETGLRSALIQRPGETLGVSLAGSNDSDRARFAAGRNRIPECAVDGRFL